MCISALVLEARLDKFFNCPSMWELLEILMAFLSLGDLDEREFIKDWQWTRHHPNDLGNEVLGLAVPFDPIVNPSLVDCVSSTTLQFLR
jgi:hypothetical protein